MITQISIVNRSGYTLRGMLNSPENAQEKVPVVINVHGFGGTLGGYKGLHTRMARELNRAGIACVRFDMYGNGESDGEFSDMTFTSLLEDTEDIFHWVAAQPWADHEHLILSGQSMGGYVVSCAAPRLNPFALILMCPGGAMWYGALERSLSMEQQGIFFADVEGLRFSTGFNKDLHQYEPFSTAAGYHGPTLLIRGTMDELVDESICEKYRSLYGEACTYLSIEGGNHNFSSLPAREACNNGILSFLEKLLP